MEPFEIPPEIFGQVPLFAEISKAMSWTGGPVNWDIARQIATALARSGSAPPIIDDDVAEIADATRLGTAWLADATGLGDQSAPPRALLLTPQEWSERALDTYPEVIDPLAAKLGGALGAGGGDDELGIGKVLSQLGPLLLGVQAGSVIGGLSRTVLTGYDVPLPLEEEHVVSVVLAHVDAHARERALDRREVRYWTVVRACALGAIFETLAWTRAHFFSLYHRYLAGIDVDVGDAISRLQEIDISDPDAVQSALGRGLFGLGDAPASAPALEALRRYLALLDATARRAASSATHGRLVQSVAIEASFERSDGDESGPSLERFLGVNVPSETRRAADGFVERVLIERGWPGVVDLWSDPERLPSESDLTDPGGWLAQA